MQHDENRWRDSFAKAGGNEELVSDLTRITSKAMIGKLAVFLALWPGFMDRRLRKVVDSGGLVVDGDLRDLVGNDAIVAFQDIPMRIVRTHSVAIEAALDRLCRRSEVARLHESHGFLHRVIQVADHLDSNLQ
ncbi:MAG TPA: hypothetical protein VNG69_05095 [Casimicrobiaceae bacterium]|nr:hypothetical protein [Casimicrobiaceae bacterium]